MDVNLSTPISKAIRTRQEYLDALKELDIHTVEDLLLYLPRTHEDLSQMQTISSAPLHEKVSIRGTVEHIKLVYTRSKKKIITAMFTDREGDSVEVIWFNQPHIKRMLKDGDEVALTGKLVESRYKVQFQSPAFESIREESLIHAGRLVPIYPQSGIITSKWLREKIALCKDCIKGIPETLPPEILEEEKLLSRFDAIRAFHFPDKPEEVRSARDRFAFEELFAIQLQALERKKLWQRHSDDRLRIPMNPELIKAFFASLKFTPTKSQKIAIYEILKDMEKDVPMSRLLEGDVGSGKTLVAVATMAHTIAHGGQCALMAPTEVLAKQHAVTIAKLLINFSNYIQEKKSITCNLSPITSLLTGSTPASEKEAVKIKLKNGQIDLVIGTHALIEDSVQFKNLLLVIIDEQHRFGVMQRKNLEEKGSPHTLSMTATPIPRTLALTAYGEHDLSVLLEKPGNRKPIDTKVVAPADRPVIERFIDREIEEGRQVFVVCPLIEGKKEPVSTLRGKKSLCHGEVPRSLSGPRIHTQGFFAPQGDTDFSDLKSVQQEIKRLSQTFPNRHITSLHGRMTPKEKEETMRAFKEKEFDILVSTSVIEVGIDVPNATVMIIEGAQRFGLAQLHQFRGRVGRSDWKSHCFLFTSSPEQAKSARLKAMEHHTDGFKLAEIDLSIRGPGELLGTLQSGISLTDKLSLMNPELVLRARKAAEKCLHLSLLPAGEG
ncbi:ATP-dependent DNA helicase RecG [Candidatus Peregrinibacteria bacterium CG22_combo_CG10-13_8_21_14_all_49_11]|nr:MAG: ATP-dependent DNA helicase RecG [Candidatus Peregrinibacteria bacterium CG22_combo_CG10-13_8_21_14_all_49_11]